MYMYETIPQELLKVLISLKSVNQYKTSREKEEIHNPKVIFHEETHIKVVF